MLSNEEQSNYIANAINIIDIIITEDTLKYPIICYKNNGISKGMQYILPNLDVLDDKKNDKNICDFIFKSIARKNHEKNNEIIYYQITQKNNYYIYFRSHPNEIIYIQNICKHIKNIKEHIISVYAHNLKSYAFLFPYELLFDVITSEFAVHQKEVTTDITMPLPTNMYIAKIHNDCKFILNKDGITIDEIEVNRHYEVYLNPNNKEIYRKIIDINPPLKLPPVFI